MKAILPSLLSILLTSLTLTLASPNNSTTLPVPAPHPSAPAGNVQKCIQTCPASNSAPGDLDPCRKNCFLKYSNPPEAFGPVDQHNAIKGTALSRRDNMKLTRAVTDCAPACKAKSKKPADRKACMKSCVLSRVKRGAVERDESGPEPELLTEDEEYVDDEGGEGLEGLERRATTSSVSGKSSSTVKTTSKTSSSAAAGSSYALGEPQGPYGQSHGGFGSKDGFGGNLDIPAGADIDVYFVDYCYIACFNSWAQKGFCYACWQDCLMKGKMVLVF